MTLDIKTILAYAATAYLIASLIYLFVSYCCLDTPFRKSLTAEQIRIKTLSAKTRSQVFWGGIIAGIIILWWLKPFSNQEIKNA